MTAGRRWPNHPPLAACQPPSRIKLRITHPPRATCPQATPTQPVQPLRAPSHTRPASSTASYGHTHYRGRPLTPVQTSACPQQPGSTRRHMRPKRSCSTRTNASCPEPRSTCTSACPLCFRPPLGKPPTSVAVIRPVPGARRPRPVSAIRDPARPRTARSPRTCPSPPCPRSALRPRSSPRETARPEPTAVNRITRTNRQLRSPETAHPEPATQDQANALQQRDETRLERRGETLTRPSATARSTAEQPTPRPTDAQSPEQSSSRTVDHGAAAPTN